MVLKEPNGLERCQLINGLEKKTMVLKELCWWGKLKNSNFFEISQLINGLERNQWSWKISPVNGLERT